MDEFRGALMKSMRMKSMRWNAVVGAVLMVAAAACGSSSTKSSGTPATTSKTGAASGNTASAPGVTPTTVTVGLVSAITGAAASTFAETPNGAKARIDLENSKGGVNGRKIQMVVADDGSTPTQDLSAVQSLVEAKGAFAVMASSSFFSGGYRYLHAQGVPVAGNPIGGPQWGQEPNRNLFSFRGGFDPHQPADTVDGQFLKSVGATNVGVLGYGNSPSSSASIKQEVFSDQAAGLKVGYQNITIPYGGVDFTAPTLAMKQAAVDGVVGSFVEASDIAMTTAIKQANLNMKAQLFFTGYGQSILNQPTAAVAAQNDYFKNTWAPVELKTPGTEGLLDGLRKYAPTYKGGVPDYGLVTGWLVADLMIKGLQVAGQNPTRESFISNLTNVTNYDAGGLLPAPVSFNHFGSYEPVPCSWFVQLKGTQFVPVPADGKPICGTLIPNSNAT